MPNNNNNNQNNRRGGSVLTNPSSPRETRNGVESAPSPRYERPARPGSGSGNSR